MQGENSEIVIVLYYTANPSSTHIAAQISFYLIGDWNCIFLSIKSKLVRASVQSDRITLSPISAHMPERTSDPTVSGYPPGNYILYLRLFISRVAAHTSSIAFVHFSSFYRHHNKQSPIRDDTNLPCISSLCISEHLIQSKGRQCLCHMWVVRK